MLSRLALCRSILLGAALVSLAVLPDSVRAQQVVTSKDYAEDFDYFWSQISENYAYFDQKQTDWNRVRQVYRPLFAQVENRNGFISLLERALEELYDFHCNLDTNLDSSAVLVPTDADIWARWQEGKATVVDVRPGSPAWRANIRAGNQVITINGVPVAEAIASRLGKCLRKSDRSAEEWALQTLLAGRHNGPGRRLGLLRGTVQVTVTLDLAHRDFPKLVNSSSLGKSGEIGYIRPNNSLGDTALIQAFDQALALLRNSKGLILDLRETPSGGNSLVARAIMGRFLAHEMFYQKHRIPAEEREYGVRRSWTEIVSPRGPFTYKGPVVVLVNHWTGSMGEGIAVGMDAIKRGQVVGVEMARLLGATDGITLPHSQISVHFPTEKLFLPNGLPRGNYVPPHYVDLVPERSRVEEDPILKAGLRLLDSESVRK